MPLCYLSAYKYTRILWILQAKKHVFVKKVCSLPFCPKVCYNDTGLLGRKEERNLSILRTIALFVYLFGYMIVHYATLRRAERALAAGDLDTVEQIVKANIPRWSRGILHVTGARMTVEGRENIPAGPCVFVGNHRSYYDIPILLTALDAPHGILAKEELEKIPLLNRWMKLLGCVFVKRRAAGASSSSPRAPATRAKRVARASSRPVPSALPSRRGCPWCRWPSPVRGACLRATACGPRPAISGCASCPPSRPQA